MASESHAELYTSITGILRAHPEGLSEYELLQALRGGRTPGFAELAFRENLSLFRAHFLLFHVLYRLREQMWQEQCAHLDISPLKIILRPYVPGTPDMPAERDPLRDYYLDVTNLNAVSRDEIDTMLDEFWVRLLANGRRRQALEVLELQDPVDYSAIKRQYRQLAMRFHPDRGGDKDRLQSINAAMAVLEKDYIR